jgi:hypothetical protein
MGRRGPKAKTLLSWMRSLVDPVRIDVEDDKDETHAVKVIRAKDGKGRWSEIESSIDALDPVRVRGFNAKGEVIGVWAFPVEPTSGRPGHQPSEDDTKEEKLLKVFAHLLADANRSAIDALEKTVALQAQHFAEERRAFSNTLLSMERLVAKASRTRFRVSELEESEERASEEPDATGDMLKSVVFPMVKQYLEGQGAPAAPTVNGAASGS